MEKVVILGASGFIGREVVRVAVEQGFAAFALVRSEEHASALRGLGATPFLGDARAAESFAAELAGAKFVLDLVQPRLPNRVSNSAIRRVATERVAATASLLQALATLHPERRPLLLSVSGVTDLAKDDRGMLSASSERRVVPVGFAQIGLAVHELVRASGQPAAFIQLGTVYGPGKAFASRLLPSLARGRLPIVGRGENRMALVHVSDAARALVHLLTLEPEALCAKTWLVADGAGSTQRAFLEHGARLMGGPVPRRLPTWLVSLLAGGALATTMSEDSPVDVSPLLDSGFRFQHPSHETGLPATVHALLGRNVGAANEPLVQVSP